MILWSDTFSTPADCIGKQLLNAGPNILFSKVSQKGLNDEKLFLFRFERKCCMLPQEQRSRVLLVEVILKMNSLQHIGYGENLRTNNTVTVKYGFISEIDSQLFFFFYSRRMRVITGT